MPILALKTEPKCKLCRHPERPAIDELLAKRSGHEKDADGNRINLEYVQAKLVDLGVVNPTAENIKIHLRRHCELITPESERQIEELAGSLEAEARRLGEEFDLAGAATADTLPDRVIQLYDLWMRAELRQGRIPKITPDQVRAMIDTKTKRRHQESITDLLSLNAAALTGAYGLTRPAEIEASPDEIAEEVE